MTKEQFWSDRPTLVTGCTGLLGSWLVERLIRYGSSVVGLIRDGVHSSRLITSGVVERITTVTGSVEDGRLIERILGEYEIDTVFHLAAQTIVGVANRNPISTFETNIRGTWQLLEACRRAPTVTRIIIASSDKAYGEQTMLPYTEATPLQGRHPYDVSKTCVDLIAQTYASVFKLPVAITRCANFFGGGDLNYNRLIPGTIRAILRGRQPLIRSDGTYIRDYLYVEDGASAYMTLAEQLDDPGIAGSAFNFSAECPVTVLDLVRRISHLMGYTGEPRVLGTASNEIPSQFLDSTRAREVLGWRAEFGLDDGLRRTIDWYREVLLEP